MSEPQVATRVALAQRLAVVGATLLGLAALAGGLLAPDMAWQGRLLLSLFGLFWLGLIPLAIRANSDRARPARARTGHWGSQAATIVDFDRMPMIRFLYLCGGLGAIFVLAAGLASASGSSSWIVCAAAGAFFGSVAVEVVLAMRRRPLVGLTPAGLALRDWNSESFLPWERLIDVSVALPRGRPAIRLRSSAPIGRKSQRLVWRLGARPEPTELDIEVQWIRPHESSLYDAILRYAQGPEHRDELGTPASLDVFRPTAG